MMKILMGAVLALGLMVAPAMAVDEQNACGAQTSFGEFSAIVNLEGPPYATLEDKALETFDAAMQSMGFGAVPETLKLIAIPLTLDEANPAVVTLKLYGEDGCPWVDASEVTLPIEMVGPALATVVGQDPFAGETE